jgi:serine phosphatase RsbU (regulator of sigma subunit)
LDTIALKIKKANNDSIKINIYSKYTLDDTHLNAKQCDSLFEILDRYITSASNEHQRIYAKINKAIILEKWNQTNKAITLFFDGLKSAEKDGYKAGELMAQTKIGYFYINQEQKNEAKTHFFKALALAQKLHNVEYESDCYSNIGTIYKNLKNGDSSLFYHYRSLDLRIKLNRKSLIASTYNNIGLTYKMLKDYPKASEFINKSLELRKENKKERLYSSALINLSKIMILMNEYQKALPLLDSGIYYASRYKHSDNLLKGMKERAELLMKLKRYEESCFAFTIYENNWDSIHDDENKKLIFEMQKKYESDAKDQNLILQNEQIKTKEAENSKQRTITIASSIALVMALIAILFVYRSYKSNKKNAIVLAAKNHLIQVKNTEITDSINYAKLIQQSLLASKEMLDKNLESYFILYKPKDIVSGDFYWASETNKGFLIACVDCTGHGVPGAFMSLIGKENLDKALTKTVNPGEILQELNVNVKRSLNQNGTSGNKDGMDAAILRIEKDKNGDAIVSYAGANRPLYILKNEGQTIEEIKATKQAVGGFTSNEQIFEEHSISVKKGDTLFITTDGYADQFGSESNKKLTTKRFKELLVSVKAKNANDQKQMLNDFFTSWQGNREQLDDMLVIGINV